MNRSDLITSVVALSRAAGDEIISIYQSGDLGVEYKADESPLTKADKVSHQVIVNGLEKLEPLAIISEEAAVAPWRVRQEWERYWLIDPLDGTKEFVKKSGEFTVNIALIDKGRPVLGVVYAPALGVLYCGAESLGAFKFVADSGAPLPIKVAQQPSATEGWKVMGSRSHQTPEFQTFVEALDKPNIMFWGSSLKLCLVAEGAADLYPRFGPTCEWDIAAGQAVLEAAGGRVIDLESKTDLRYNSKDSLLNPSFVACAEPSPVWLQSI